MQQEPDFEQVAKSLRSDDIKIRKQGAKKLSAFVDHRSVSVLTQAFLDPSNSAIRNDISNALVQLNKLSVPSLISLLGKDDKDIHVWAIWTLSKIADQESYEPVLQDFFLTRDSRVRRTALCALASINFPQSIDVIRESLNDKNASLRAVAAGILSQDKDEKTINALILSSHDKDRNVRLQSVYALETIGDPSTFNNILVLLQDSDSSVRIAAAHALFLLDSAQSVEPLVRMLNDVELSVVSNILVLLSGVRDSHLKEALTALLHNDHAEIRQQAARTLMLMDDK